MQEKLSNSMKLMLGLSFPVEPKGENRQELVLLSPDDVCMLIYHQVMYMLCTLKT